jgi:two-component system cell cycle sensor histidine kinase/response regulator CckA
MSTLSPRLPHLVSHPPAALSADPAAQRILVVEPSDRLRAETAQTLSARGYAVIEARHGEDALRVIEQTEEPFDLVVTELVMPVMSGYMLGRHLARQSPGLPVLYISATVRETLVRFGTPSGRTLFIRKPFRPEDLVREVTRSVNSPRTDC